MVKVYYYKNEAKKSDIKDLIDTLSSKKDKDSRIKLKKIKRGGFYE